MLTTRRNNNLVEVPVPHNSCISFCHTNRVDLFGRKSTVDAIFPIMVTIATPLRRMDKKSNYALNISILFRKRSSLWLIDNLRSQLRRTSGTRTEKGLMLLSRSLRLHQHGAASLSSVKSFWMKLKLRKKKLKSLTFR